MREINAFDGGREDRSCLGDREGYMRTTKFENDHSPMSENPANPQAKTNKIVRQRLIFFSIQRVERAEYVERME